MSPDSQVVKQEVSVGVRNLNAAEFKEAFDAKLEGKPYVPVQLYINNMSNNTYTIDASNINQSLCIRSAVINSISRSTVGHFLAFGVIGAYASSQVNQGVNHDLDERAFCNAEHYIIYPKTEFNRVLFIDKKQYTTDLQLALINTATARVDIEYSFNLPPLPVAKK